METVYTFLKNHISKEEPCVVVGVSGGADSMTLLTLLKNYFSSNCKIICAHVHHNLRKESDEEQLFVKKYCEEHQIVFETIKLTYEDSFTEEIGREKRYQFFEEILNKYRAKYLFTAHHGDDLTETILMRLTRGTTLKGACGISSCKKRDGYTILRPLLFFSKRDIYQYAKEHKIPYVEDNSNQDSHYTRNRYRMTILPFLKKENPKVHLKFLEYSEDLQEVLEFVHKKSQEFYPNIVIDKKINWHLLQTLDVAIQKEMIREYFFSIYQQEIRLINRNHRDLFLEFIRSGTVHSTIPLPKYCFIKNYDWIEIEENQEKEDYQILLQNELELPNHHKIEQLSFCEEKSNYVTYLDSSMVSLPLYVRNFQEGDKMTIKNMNGHKKVSDIFTDEKIPLECRKEHPIVVDSKGTIIWLPGIKKSQFDKKKEEIYDIILKYY